MTQDDLRTFLAASYGATMVAPLLAAYANQTYPVVNASITQWYWVAERTITDHQFACPTILATQWLTTRPTQSPANASLQSPPKGAAQEVYQYYFTDTDGASFVGHGAEVEYVFNEEWRFTSTSQQTQALQFNDWWRSFIAGSAPTSDRCASPSWPKGEGNQTYTIANGCQQGVASNLKAVECAVWEDYLVASTQQ